MGRLDGTGVIFDLDGTLADTAPDLVRALNAVARSDGMPPATLADVRMMVGRGARALLRRAYANAGTALPDPLLDARVTQFIEVYAADIAAESRLFPGAVEAMDALEAAGAKLSLATNKPDGLTHLLLKALGLAGRFDPVVGATRAPRRKPDAAHLLAALPPGVTAARALMVGDSGTDVAAARNAGIAVVVMTHGYSETAFEKLGADRELASFTELLPAALEILR